MYYGSVCVVKIVNIDDMAGRRHGGTFLGVADKVVLRMNSKGGGGLGKGLCAAPTFLLFPNLSPLFPPTPNPNPHQAEYLKAIGINAVELLPVRGSR
jgi:hypothetical protein